jgi:hypothetical protein
VRHVADRMPDRGKRGKDIAILQMAQDAYRDARNTELRYMGNDQAVLAHSGLVVARSQVPPTRRSIRANPDELVASRPISEVAICFVEVRLARYGRLDLVTLSSSHFGPYRKCGLGGSAINLGIVPCPPFDARRLPTFN